MTLLVQLQNIFLVFNVLSGLPSSHEVLLASRHKYHSADLRETRIEMKKHFTIFPEMQQSCEN
jgi:hypothetical protein